MITFQRYHLQCETHFIQFEQNLKGYEDAMRYRAVNKRYKGKHIIKSVQLKPVEIELGKEYEITR